MYTNSFKWKGGKNRAVWRTAGMPLQGKRRDRRQQDFLPPLGARVPLANRHGQAERRFAVVARQFFRYGNTWSTSPSARWIVWISPYLLNYPYLIIPVKSAPRIFLRLGMRGAERSPQVLAPQRLAAAESDGKYIARSAANIVASGGCKPGGRGTIARISCAART